MSLQKERSVLIDNNHFSILSSQLPFSLTESILKYLQHVRASVTPTLTGFLRVMCSARAVSKAGFCENVTYLDRPELESLDILGVTSACEKSGSHSQFGWLYAKRDNLHQNFSSGAYFAHGNFYYRNYVFKLRCSSTCVEGLKPR